MSLMALGGKSDATPYRTAAIVKHEEKPFVKVGKGFLIVKGKKPVPPHRCNKPGFWRRLWSGIKFEGIWVCECGDAFRFGLDQYNQKRDGWHSMDYRQRDKHLLDNGYSNPWKKDK